MNKRKYIFVGLGLAVTVLLFTMLCIAKMEHTQMREATLQSAAERNAHYFFAEDERLHINIPLSDAAESFDIQSVDLLSAGEIV